jgi:hypothetical protein
LKRFPFVGFVENFKESLLLLCYTFGWIPHNDNRIYNYKPQGALKREDLSDDVIKKLMTMNELDYFLYNTINPVFNKAINDLTLEKVKNTYFNKVSKQKKLSKIHIDFSDTIPGNGWHTREKDDNSYYCWSGPNNTSSLFLNLDNYYSYLAKVMIPSSMSKDIMQSLKIYINDNEIQYLLLSEFEKGGLIQFNIPYSLLLYNEITEIMFCISHTIKPIELDSNTKDDRKLGLLFSWIDIYKDVTNISFKEDSLNKLEKRQKSNGYEPVETSGQKSNNFEVKKIQGNIIIENTKINDYLQLIEIEKKRLEQIKKSYNK